MIKKTLLIAGFIMVSLAFNNNVEPAIPLHTSNEIIKNTTEKANPSLSIEEEINLLYEDFSVKNSTMPSLISFQNAMLGYYKLLEEEKIENEILTIVDFSLSSAEKRMWIMDMDSKKVLFNTYVSHGENTGMDMATKFSNIQNSHQSSLGFYLTAETYFGKHGLSLRMDGLEKGFNSNARDRYIVIHGADYATPAFVERVGRLGRSYGCPAVPTALSQEIIENIKERSCFFIYYPSEDYLQNSEYLNSEMVS